MTLNTYITIKWYVFLFISSFSISSISAQCLPICNDQVNISLDASGFATIDPFSVLQGNLSPECLNTISSLEINISGANHVQGNHNSIIITSAILNCSFINQNIPYTLNYIFNNGDENSCWGNILLEDKMNPSLSCSDLEIECMDAQSPADLALIYPNAIPTNSDNCIVNSLNHSDTFEDYGCSNLNFSGKITRLWIAIDNSGNTTSCIQNIFIKKPNASNLVFPDNLDDISLSILDCPMSDYSPTITGYPTINGQPITNGNSCQLSVVYNDNSVNICGNGKKIIRSWLVMDNCTNQMYNHTQFIKIADKTAPIISCPTIQPIGTTSNGCSGNVFIPEANIVDACSGFTVITETPNGTLNGNGGMVTNLPLGTHDITYIATDECGNTSSCNNTITIIDNIAPITICDEHTVVSLTSDGTATVNANTFDDGSYDNCEIVDFKVRRMATTCEPQSSFADQVTFSCCDVNSANIMVELMVTDAAGNSNSCMIEVEVDDKLDPIITCPSNKTIDCTQDIFNFGLVGQPLASDNCPGLTIQRIDNNNLNSCGLGTVNRIWTAVDVHGRTSSCVQIITVINSYPFDENDIIYPFDLTTSECGVSSLSPDELNHPYARPTLNDDACDQVAVNYEDIYLPVAAPACFKILRKWTVIDWCQFNPNAVPDINGNVPGKWTHTQKITVIDYSPPVFVSCPNDLIFDSFNPNCGNTAIELIVEAEDCSPDLSYSYEIDLNDDGFIENSGLTNDASGNYPLGNHKIYFTVADGCGNLGFCSFSFQIRDTKKPTPVCINGLSADLDENGSLTLWANDFESGSSFDNCTQYEDLIFSFSSNVNHTSMVFDCSDQGEQPIQLWITDEEGNQDFCITFIDIQDNTFACPTPSFSSISGNIQTADGINIENAKIVLQEDLTNPDFTTSNGNFSFDNLPQGFNYTVAPEKNTSHLNGVTTLDMVLITKHILGIELLNSPYKLIAADVNKSGTITTMDVVQIQRLILNMDSQFQNNTSWRFVDSNFIFNNALSDEFSESISFPNLNQNVNANFIAIKIGDVNHTASPDNFSTGDTREKTGNLFFQIENKIFKKGEQVEVFFTVNDFKDVIGYQFSLQFNNRLLAFENINPLLENLSNENFNSEFTTDGIITTSWHQPHGYHQKENEVFSLIFNALADGQLINNIQINSVKTPSEAYRNENILNVELKTENVTTQLHTKEIQLFQNKPNPFKDQTTIGLIINNSENGILEVTDVSGKILKKINKKFQKGYNEITLNKADLNAKGIAFYTLYINGKHVTKTMVLKD